MLVKKMLELLMNYSDTEKFVMEVKLHYRDGNPISYFDVYSKEKTIVLRDDSNRPMEKRQPDISLAVNSINYSIGLGDPVYNLRTPRFYAWEHQETPE